MSQHLETCVPCAAPSSRRLRGSARVLREAASGEARRPPQLAASPAASCQPRARRVGAVLARRSSAAASTTGTGRSSAAAPSPRRSSSTVFCRRAAGVRARRPSAKTRCRRSSATSARRRACCSSKPRQGRDAAMRVLMQVDTGDESASAGSRRCRSMLGLPTERELVGALTERSCTQGTSSTWRRWPPTTRRDT